MNRYKDYSLEDFVLDAQFQNWVRYKRPAETASWQNYLTKNPSQSKDITQAKSLLESVYSHYKTHLNDSEIDFEIHQLLDKIRNDQYNISTQTTEVLKAPRRTMTLGRMPAFWAAASIIFVLCLGWLYQDKLDTKISYLNLTAGKSLKEIINDTKVNKIVVLSDGSRLILKPDSKISFPEKFLADKREIYLSGDAFFEVSKDAKRPFLVYTNELVTKVLGTSFAISQGNTTHKTTVEVTEGKVSVFRQNDFLDTKSQKVLQSKGMVLTANQKLVFEQESSDMLKTIRDKPEVVISNETPKTFDFVNIPASVVLGDLRDAYQVDIIFDKDLLYDCPVTASLTRQSLFEKLDIICEVIEAHYEMLDGKIVVYSKGCKN